MVQWIGEGPFSPNRFVFTGAAQFVAKPERVSDIPGVYGLFFRGAERLLEATEYFELVGTPLVRLQEYLHFYTGSSYVLQKRLKDHLVGESRTSSLRKTLFAIDHCCHGIISRELLGLQNRFDEAELSCWLLSNAVIAFQECSDPELRECELLERTASPLNIQERRANPYARRLSAMRSIFDQKPVQPCCWGAIPQWLISDQKCEVVA